MENEYYDSYNVLTWTIVHFIIGKQFMTDPLRSQVEYDGEEEGDEIPNEASIVEHRHQIRYEHANEDGQNSRHQFYSALQEEVFPFLILWGVSIEYDDVDIIDCGVNHQREGRADINTGKQYDEVGESP